MLPIAARPARDDRMQLLDASRVVAAIGVVGTHVVAEYFPGDTIYVLGTFAVPFYLFVALYFTVRGLVRDPERSLPVYLLGRVRKLYLPFLLWNVIYDVLHVLWHRGEHMTSPWLMTWAAVYTHLYFLPFLLAVTVLTAILARPLVARPSLTKLVAAAMVATALVIACAPQPTQWRDPMQIRWETLWNAYRALPAALAAMAFALIVGPRPMRLSFTPTLGVTGLLLTLACVTAEWRFGEHPALRAASGFGLVLIAFVPLSLGRFGVLAALGRLSFGVYLAHVAIIRIIVALLDHRGVGQTPVAAAIVMFAALAGGFALSAALSRSRWTSWMIGCDDDRKPRRRGAVTTPACVSPSQTARPQIADPLPSAPH